MLITAIILGIIALTCGIGWLVYVITHKDEYDFFLNQPAVLLGTGFWVIGCTWLICFLSSLNWQLGSQDLTGYIYSSTNQAGYTTAHIRFSQNAGTDAQPDFCVKTNSAAGRTIAKYAGSDQKVRVNIPSYFYFANNPFACGTTAMTIQPIAK